MDMDIMGMGLASIAPTHTAATIDTDGGRPAAAGVFPDDPAPVIRDTETEREMSSMR